jgi:hypothetical protein
VQHSSFVPAVPLQLRLWLHVVRQMGRLSRSERLQRWRLLLRLPGSGL